MRTSKMVKVLAILLGVLSTAGFVIPAKLSAQESSIPVSIGITGKVDPRLIPVVYVDGVLAGAIEGIIRVPVAAESTIEIGLPQARQPLYSFALGAKQFDSQTVNVVMTSYSYETGNSDALWAGVKLKPNSIGKVHLEPVSSGGFEIRLPRSPYDSYQAVITTLDGERWSKNWLEAIPKVNDESKRNGVSHLTAVVNDAEAWSGAYSAQVRASWPSPGYPDRNWKITSEPAGARIMTQVGDKGLTDRTVPLPDLSETFVVLQLADYVDCPHDSDQCTKIDRGNFTELQCTLKKK